MTSTPLLELREVVAGYTGPVVGPVSFSIAPGDILGLHGSNGAGKSTLLGVITGKTRVFAGTVFRRPGIGVAHHRQRPVRPAELPLTGFELLALTGASCEQAPPPLRKILGERLDRLSGGQFQLLHIWACLGSPADLVLLDEPTNNLDPDAVSILTGMLRDGSGQRGILVVSHEADFLAAVCRHTLRITP